MYVECKDADETWAYAIDPATGTLSAVRGSPFGTLAAAPVSIDPEGRFLFMTEYLIPGSDVRGGGILVYSIDAASGALSAVMGSPSVTPSYLSQAFFDPSGTFVCFVNSVSPAIFGFTLSAAGGALTPIPGGPYGLGRVFRAR